MSDQKFQDFLKKLRPMDDRILVEPIEEETATSFGLVLPDTASKEKPQKTALWQLVRENLMKVNAYL